MVLNCGAGEDSSQSPGLQGDPTSQSSRRSVLNIHSKDWGWSSNSNTLATWWEELTHWKRPWCWERLKAGGERDNKGWDGWMASPTQQTWVWTNSGNWWWTGRSGALQSMGSQRVRHDRATELRRVQCSAKDASQLQVFSNESVLHSRWPKNWSFSFSISPSNEYSGLISFRIDWFDLFAVQGTLKSLLQHHSSKSINSLVLSCLYSSTLTSIHDYWENYSFD